MAEQLLRIATRKSPLAVWQAEHVASCLRDLHPHLRTELVRMTTEGDRILDSPLASVGGKGLFVKELEQGLLEGRADIAVHSMKDVPVDLPPGLELPVILIREDPRDAFVSPRHESLDELPQGARVGSSSMRRQLQIRERFPHLRVETLRGNVNTRLRKLDEGEFEAILLAVAGLRRLGFGQRVRAILDPQVSLPAIGQGALGIECRADDPSVHAWITPLNHHESELRVRAERALNRRLHGGCQVPIAGYAEIEGGALTLRGLVGQPDGSRVLRGEISGHPEEAESLGTALAERLLAQGADEILAGLTL